MGDEAEPTPDPFGAEAPGPLSVTRELGRIEGALAAHREECLRRIEHQTDEIGHAKAAASRANQTASDIHEHLAKLRLRVEALERHDREIAEIVRRSEDVSGRAMRTAGEARHEVKATQEGLVEHLRKLEVTAKDDADAAAKQRAESERARQRAAGAHAKRFEEQGEAIQRLTAVVQRSEAQSARGKWILGAVIAIITVLGQQAIELVKIVYAPPPPVVREIPR